MRRKTSIPEGTRLFHSTTPKSVYSILQEGILKNVEHKFADPEMGTQGLHLSSEAESYLDDERTDLIVFELKHHTEGTKTLAYQELLRKAQEWGLKTKEIDYGYNFLSQTSPLLQNAGLYPKNTEFLLTNPADSLRIKGIIPNADLDVSIGDQELIPVDDYCKDKGIALHPMWQERELANVSTSYSLFKKGEKRVFFKLPRERHCMFGSTDYALLAETGASSLARKLLGTLVPEAKLSYHKGKRGISQDYVEGNPLVQDLDKESDDYCFDVKKLKAKQIHQLFAHMLVDWVLANHDNTPNQFLITPNGDLVGLDKGQAYKFFKGSEVQARFVDMGAEKDLPKSPSFADLDVDPMINVYAALREAIKNKEVTVDLKDPLIQKVLKGLSELGLKEVANALGPYARISFPGREGAFFQSVLDRAHRLSEQAQEFLN